MAGVFQILVLAGERVGTGDAAGDADRLGAEWIRLHFAEDDFAIAVGEVGLAVNGVFLVEVAKALDFGQRLERGAARVVLLDGGTDGGEQLGLDAPTGALGDFEQFVAGVALDTTPNRERKNRML
jgi:hypothetical protein